MDDNNQFDQKAAQKKEFAHISLINHDDDVVDDSELQALLSLQRKKKNFLVFLHPCNDIFLHAYNYAYYFVNSTSCPDRLITNGSPEIKSTCAP